MILWPLLLPSRCWLGRREPCTGRGPCWGDDACFHMTVVECVAAQSGDQACGWYALDWQCTSVLQHSQETRHADGMRLKAVVGSVVAAFCSPKQCSGAQW